MPIDVSISLFAPILSRLNIIVASEKGKAAAEKSQAPTAPPRSHRDTPPSLAGLSLGGRSSPDRSSPAPKAPPRPVQPPKEEDNDSVEEDENDPFGDSNAVQTPSLEKSQNPW